MKENQFPCDKTQMEAVRPEGGRGVRVRGAAEQIKASLALTGKDAFVWKQSNAAVNSDCYISVPLKTRRAGEERSPAHDPSHAPRSQNWPGTRCPPWQTQQTSVLCKKDGCGPRREIRLWALESQQSSIWKTITSPFDNPSCLGLECVQQGLWLSFRHATRKTGKSFKKTVVSPGSKF